MSIKSSIKKNFASLYNIADYKDGEEAFEALESLAKDRSLPDDKKEVLNRNFYSYLRQVEKLSGENIIKPVIKGILYLKSLSLEDREKLYLYGDDYGYTWKLIDGTKDYQSAVKENGMTKFPSQFMFLAHIIILNDLEGVGE